MRGFSQSCLGGVFRLQTQEIPLKIRSREKKWLYCSFFPLWGFQMPLWVDCLLLGQSWERVITILISKEIEARCRVACEAVVSVLAEPTSGPVAPSRWVPHALLQAGLGQPRVCSTSPFKNKVLLLLGWHPAF